MSNEAIFAARVNRINKASHGIRRAKTPSARRLGERLLTPIMLVCCLTGGLTAVWDGMDRPTDTPLALAGDLTSQLISYFGTI